MGALIGFSDNTKAIEQPNSPEVDYDTAGNVATTRFYAVKKEYLATYLAGKTPTDSDPIWTGAKLRGIRVSAFSPSIRIVSERYEPVSWGFSIIGPVGTVEREADANALITPVEGVAPDSPGIQAIKADGLDGKLTPQPIYRYRKVKSSFTWNEANIISGVGKIDNTPTGIEGVPSIAKWLLMDHSVTEAGGVVQEEWGWQYADNGWRLDLYDVWSGAAG